MLVDNLEYNTEREHLIIPEYGRHIQKMVNQAIAMEDREERNKCVLNLMWMRLIQFLRQKS